MHKKKGVGSHSVGGLLSQGSVDFGLCLWKTPSWDASTICPVCEILTGPLSLCPYLIPSQYRCGLRAPFSSCSLMCLCCMYLLSLSFNLFAHVSVSLPLWFCVSPSLIISLFVPLCWPLPPTPHWNSVSMKETRFWEPEPLGYKKEELHFQELTARPRDPRHLPCQPNPQDPWPRKGEVMGSKP